ncbi:MAG: SH3 domain-containing protein [Candidatus Avilachnospira sp.]|jgi:cell wall-associated NlpC family hydrolase
MGSSQRNNQFNDEDRAEKEPLISDESFREKYRDILGDDDSEPEITHKWKSRKKKSFVEEVNIKQLILLIIVLIAVILAAVFGIRSCVRAVGNGKTDIEGSIASASEATVSEAERAELERERLTESVISEYDDLAVVTASGYINMRSAPNTVDMTNIIGKLPQNAACDIVETDGEWSLVESGGIRGYVYNTYLATGDEAKEMAGELIKERAVVTVPKLNIRTEPVIDPENVLGSALEGERYEVISTDGNWAKIVADKIEGVEEAFISVSDGNAEIRECMDEAKRLDLREMVLTQYDNLVVSATDGYINIRETPEDKGIDNICGKFPEAAGAELLETVENDGRIWYKIKSGPVTGYIAAEYTVTGQGARDTAVDNAILTAVITTDSLNVRTEPSLEAEVWTQVTKNQEYHVLDQLDGWVEIELDSSDGDEEADKAYISTRDNNVDVRYGLAEAVEYYPAVEAANAAAAFRNEIVNYACQFVGNPYVWGGTSLTKGADCSGFVMSVLKHFGISVPRVSRDQARAGVRVTSDQMKPGDLVFYANSSGTVNHVGMYIGNGQVVNAASRRSGIRIYRWNYRTPVAIRNVIGP